MALFVTIYLSLLGKKGFKEVGTRSYKSAHYLAKKLTSTGKFSLIYDQPFFNEFVVKTSVNVDKLNEALLSHNILGGHKIGDNEWLYC